MLQQLYQFIQTHPGISFVIWYIFTCCVVSLPSPDASSGKFYVWLFSVLHMIINAAQFKKVQGSLPDPTAVSVTVKAAQPGLSTSVSTNSVDKYKV